ncbi:MAG: pilus assembly PilX N-terminal domain-containing protein, partial [Candidatus Methylomirabilis sp.]
MRSMRRLWKHTLGNEDGSALVLGLVLILAMTLLGVALFDLGTIEVSLAKGTVSDTQAFYCAEAEAKRIYNLYGPFDATNNPTGDPDGTLAGQTFTATTLTLINGSYTFSGSATVNDATHVVTV